MAKRPPKYPTAKTEERIRITVLFKEDELERIDEWGVGEGMPDRAKAIRALIERGLAA